jgi:hypothetical protein
MRITAALQGNLDAYMAEEIDAAETAVTAGVRAAADGLKGSWRGQIVSSGLGDRLARTIRERYFPPGRKSLNAAALVYSRANKLVDAFDRGVLIRSKAGFFLAIPTEAAGKYGDGRKRITPGGWERRTGLRLRFVYRPRAPSLLVIDNAKLTSRGRAVANVTRRRDGTSYTRLAGRQTIPVFILVPQVRLPKRLDLDRAARLWEGRLPDLILANWPQNSGSST